MAKLQFIYATMDAGKTTDLIMTADKYEKNKYKVLVLKPSDDTKGEEYITCRIGLKRKVDYLIGKDDNVLDLLKGNLENVKCIFIDESQFLKTKQVDQLNLITKSLDIPVMAYGLRVNFRNELFEGSKRLMEVSDELVPLNALCNCSKPAAFGGRTYEGEFTTEGEEVVIDGSDPKVDYVPLCGSCYMKKVLKLDLNKVKKYLR